MPTSIRKPEEILAFRTLRELLQGKPRECWTVAPGDSVLKAAQLMDEKNIGCVVVTENGQPVGILTERDCVRRVMVAGKSAETTRVADIMVRDIIAVGPDHTFADCLRLMHRHGIRHLPVLEGRACTGVVSIRDLAAEAVSHHARIISELERERLQIFTSTV
jgi:signal-transduction protein with cAMP-binding, CBS, and nucleotidyltransferase domain